MNDPSLAPFEKSIKTGLAIKIIDPQDEDFLQALKRIDVIEVPSWFPENIRVHNLSLDKTVYPWVEHCLECN